MSNLIIGTAGHVDHGKTMLIKALTGIDTDRLKIEKERGISIELGYAFCRLPSGRRAGIVDVPGHERFIKNMLAGVGGIDLVLLVIAADEGIMPQTREHMDIIELLRIKQGVVALTKVDLVDQELLELVREEVRDFLQTTSLKNAPIVEVSSVTGKGLPELLEVIDQVAARVNEKPAAGPVRLPIDRAFSIPGFGTVVTGTLWSGAIRTNDGLEIMPQGLPARVRSLQVHGEKVAEARAGQRVAVNIPGIEVTEVGRGSVLVQKGAFRPAVRMDVKLFLLKDAPKALTHRSRVRFYLGTAEILGRVLLLDREELAPGQAAYAQLLLEEPTVAARGDRFILRSYSPMRTIGGGTIIDPAAGKHKRRRPEVIAALAAREKGDPRELVLDILKAGKNKLLTTEEIKQAGIDQEILAGALEDLINAEKVQKIQLDQEDYFVSTEVYQGWVKELKNLLGKYHREYPLRNGLPREELRSRLLPALNSRQFQALLEAMAAQGIIKMAAQTVALSDFSPHLNERQQKAFDRIEKEYIEAGLQPPRWGGAAAVLKDAEEAQELLQYCLRRGVLVKVADDLYFHAGAIARARKLLLDYLAQKGEITVGEARDVWQTSRKYALPLLEYFDQNKVTKRVGDKRVVR
ncbi:MAG: selenocysteine-specific translation elongation factor [Bacillota bacterium]